jgi:hypothetical protein
MSRQITGFVPSQAGHGEYQCVLIRKRRDAPVLTMNLETLGAR